MVAADLDRLACLSLGCNVRVVGVSTLHKNLERWADERANSQAARDMLELLWPVVEALAWIAGVNDSKPYTTYYERDVGDGQVVPPYYEIAQEALAELERKLE
jgi:hypothetical protein